MRALLAAAGLLVACSRVEPPATRAGAAGTKAASAALAAATPKRFSILESIEQPEGYALLRVHDSKLGNLPAGGIIQIPAYGECRELPAVESMLNFVTASTASDELGSISRVECGRDRFDVTTVNSMPCGCDFGKRVQVARRDGELTLVKMTDWMNAAPGVEAPAK